MARYGQAFRDRLVARLLPPESAAIDVVSREAGVSVATLERWRAGALAAPGALTSTQRWTPAARLEAVITTAAKDEGARSSWCREQGLYPAELEAWKHDAIAGLGEPRAASAVEARQDRRRVKEPALACGDARPSERQARWRRGSCRCLARRPARRCRPFP
ncbi:transposase [Falsiroseomonas sp. HC035]|uniref:transposase n=1 Tax=Falsiroseomonas sp. HC035 TaxID=3390999 RepID=UPI003D30F721